jgi:Flp pilus assembly protein TadG
MSAGRSRSERGAVVPIIAISLVALFGMVVLTVDVGGLMVKRRNMVNAADAAALAAAQSYASEEAVCGSLAGDALAKSQADGLAGDNVSNAVPDTTRPPYQVDCTRQRVRVAYEAPTSLFFAPVLGFGNSSMVRSSATAIWGTLGSGSAVPIVLDSGKLQSDCDVPNIPRGTQCAFWYDNSLLGDADWGFMNLDLWNVSPTTSCSNAGADDRRDWIEHNYPDPNVLNGDPPGSRPTYVCVDTGHTSADWQNLHLQEGQFKLFPVNDCSGQLDKDGNVLPCPATPDKYDIIGFTSLKIVKVYKGNDPQAVGVPGASGTCQKSNNDIATFQTLSLDSFGLSQNCFATAPDNIPYSGVQLSPRSGPAYTKCQPGDSSGSCDYWYDESTHVLTWRRAAAARVTVKFDWSNDSIGGACPGHTSDPNAICLVTEWDGFRVYSGILTQGPPDLGPRAVRLLE